MVYFRNSLCHISNLCAPYEFKPANIYKHNDQRDMFTIACPTSTWDRGFRRRSDRR